MNTMRRFASLVLGGSPARKLPDTLSRLGIAGGADVVIVERDEAGRASIPDLLDALGKRDVQGLLVDG